MGGGGGGGGPGALPPSPPVVKLLNFRRLNKKVQDKEAMMHYFTHRPKQSFRGKNRTVAATQHTQKYMKNLDL